MGTPKHPLFLLGKKYSDGDSKADQARAARARIGALGRWYAGRGGVRSSAGAASHSDRHAANLQAVLHRPVGPSQMLTRLQTAAQSAHLHFIFRFLHGSPRHYCARAQPHGNLSVPNAVGDSSAILASDAQAAMQHNSDAQEPKQTSRLGSSTARPLPAANSSADPAASHTFTGPDSAIDLEAQNGQDLTPDLRASLARTSTARSDLEEQQDSLTNDSCDGVDSEPTDVAAERATADRLWAERSGLNGDADFSGPAILLHNLRKVRSVLDSMYKASVPQITAADRQNDFAKCLIA